MRKVSKSTGSRDRELAGQRRHCCPRSRKMGALDDIGNGEVFTAEVARNRRNSPTRAASIPFLLNLENRACSEITQAHNLPANSLSELTGDPSTGLQCKVAPPKRGMTVQRGTSRPRAARLMSKRILSKAKVRMSNPLSPSQQIRASPDRHREETRANPNITFQCMSQCMSANARQ